MQYSMPGAGMFEVVGSVLELNMLRVDIDMANNYCTYVAGEVHHFPNGEIVEDASIAGSCTIDELADMCIERLANNNILNIKKEAVFCIYEHYLEKELK